MQTNERTKSNRPPLMDRSIAWLVSFRQVPVRVRVRVFGFEVPRRPPSWKQPIGHRQLHAPRRGGQRAARRSRWPERANNAAAHAHARAGRRQRHPDESCVYPQPFANTGRQRRTRRLQGRPVGAFHGDTGNNSSRQTPRASGHRPHCRASTAQPDHRHARRLAHWRLELLRTRGALGHGCCTASTERVWTTGSQRTATSNTHPRRTERPASYVDQSQHPSNCAPRITTPPPPAQGCKKALRMTKAPTHRLGRCFPRPSAPPPPPPPPFMHARAHTSPL